MRPSAGHSPRFCHAPQGESRPSFTRKAATFIGVRASSTAPLRDSTKTPAVAAPAAALQMSAATERKTPASAFACARVRPSSIFS